MLTTSAPVDSNIVVPSKAGEGSRNEEWTLAMIDSYIDAGNQVHSLAMLR